MGDTSAFVRLVHSTAVPPIPTTPLRPPHPRAPKLPIPPSRLAQVLLPHQPLLTHVPSTSTTRVLPTVSLASPTQRILPPPPPPRRDRFRNDAHGCILKRTFLALADAYLPASTDAAVPLGHVTAISERHTREARPTRQTTSPHLPVHIVATRSCCSAARLGGAVLNGTSCSAEQRADEH